MERITSFSVDHTKLKKGVYVSRVDGDLTTFDIRMCTPNIDTPLDPKAAHTIEHIGATLLRNGDYKDHIIYFGPMGCQTGFYLLIRNADDKQVFEITKKVLQEILDHEGPVFGASAVECGNYRNLDLAAAKEECRTYLEVLKKQTNMEFTYPQ